MGIKKNGMRIFADEMMLLGKIQQLLEMISKLRDEKKKLVVKYNKTQKKGRGLSI